MISSFEFLSLHSIRARTKLLFSPGLAQLVVFMCSGVKGVGGERKKKKKKVQKKTSSPVPKNSTMH